MMPPPRQLKPEGKGAGGNESASVPQDEASYITGTTLTPDGGYTLTM